MMERPGDTVRFGVLGPLQVLDDAGIVRTVPAAKQRIVLAALLLGNGSSVSAASLAEALWDASPPPNAPAVMRTYVARLRRALGPVATRIVGQPSGWAIELHGPEELDLAEVDRLWLEARAASESAQWREASSLLSRALSIWRGDPLVDVPSAALARRETARLDELKIRLIETRIDADLNVGRHEELVSELRRLTAEHPLREHLRAQLMLACYRCGQQAAALEVYRDAHRILTEELGVEPGHELRETHQRILAADPLTVNRHLAGDDLQRPATGYRHGLPLDPVGFTGREKELELISRALTGGAVAIRAIGGMPGVGKTALAVHAAHRLADSFPDRRLFIDLHGHTPGWDPDTAEDALASLLAAVGVDARFLPPDLAGRAALWRDKMAAERMLLVLDNAASSAQVIPLLPGEGSSLVLVTSRRHLADLPGPVVSVAVDPLSSGQARAMFLQMAPRAVDGELTRVDELMEVAGYLPLAVSLLARLYARHPSWTLPDLIAETHSSLLTLTAEDASVAIAFEVSWRHLDPAAQRFLALLSMHPGTSIDRYVAAALAGVPLMEATRQLDGLHSEGLLAETGYRRYRLHDLIRKYATAQAEAAWTGERRSAVGRLLDYYVRAATLANTLMDSPYRSDPPGTEPPAPDLAGSAEALAWARAERANLLACFSYATASGSHSSTTALASALTGLLRRDGPWAEAIAVQAAGVAAARCLRERPGLIRCLINLGTAQRLAGKYQDAAGALTEALDLCRDPGDRKSQADALRELGRLSMQSSDYTKAAESADQSLEICTGIGDKLGEARALILLGSVWRRTDEFTSAAEALTDAVDLCRDLGERESQADALRELGDVRRLTGDYQAAAGYLEQALALSRELGDRFGQANALNWLGGVHRQTGHYQAAVAALEQSLPLHDGLGNRNGQANALALLGDLRQAVGDYQAATGDLEQALRLYRELGSLIGEMSVLGWLGDLRRATGDYPGAAESPADALALSRQIGDRGAEATGLNSIGGLYHAQGDIVRARDCHQQALQLAREIASRWDEAHALAGLGRCARADGDLPRAVGLFSQAHQIFHDSGAVEAADTAAELRSITTDPTKSSHSRFR